MEEVPGLGRAPIRLGGLIAWVAEVAALTRPAAVHWCDWLAAGAAGPDWPAGRARHTGPPQPAAAAGSFLASSHSSDVAWVEDRTADLQLLLSVDPGIWHHEAALIGEHLATFGQRLPQQLWEQHDARLGRLAAAG